MLFSRGKAEQSLGSAPQSFSLWPCISGTLYTSLYPGKGLGGLVSLLLRHLRKEQVSVWLPLIALQPPRSSLQEMMLGSILFTTCPGMAVGTHLGGWQLQALALPSATSHARMVMATQQWETHQGRSPSLEAELLILLLPGLP